MLLGLDLGTPALLAKIIGGGCGTGGGGIRATRRTPS